MIDLSRGPRSAIDRLSVWAVRYALGRMTYAVADVVYTLIAYSDALSTKSRTAILRDIDEALEAGDAGMAQDADHWRRLRDALRGRSEETAWLIERGQPEGLRRPQWWAEVDGRSGAFGWMLDQRRATRYPSREAAEAVIARFDRPGHPFHARAVEHLVEPPEPPMVERTWTESGHR